MVSAKYVGIEGVLRMIAVRAAWGRLDFRFQALAGQVAGWVAGRDAKILHIVRELRRRFVYVADPIGSECFQIPFELGSTIDVDEACLFVMTLAGALGIPCRIVGAQCDRRYWTCLVAYENEAGLWTGIFPLQQKVDHVVVNELIFVEEPL